MNNGQVLIISLIFSVSGAVLAVQGCSSAKTKKDRSQSVNQENPSTPTEIGESTGFRSAAVAMTAPTEAEVALDLNDLGITEEQKRAIAATMEQNPPDATNPELQTSTATGTSKTGAQPTVAGAPPSPNLLPANLQIRGKGRGKSASGAMNYVVLNGDTLMKISFKVFGDPFRWKEIFEDNRGKIRNPNLLTRGTIVLVRSGQFAIILKNGKSYFIKRNDTLSKISAAVYGTIDQWPKIWKNNPQLIHDPNRIYAGFTLYYVPQKSSENSNSAKGL